EPMRVLSGANMPAALIEMAYLTNAAQEQLAQSPDFQNGIAQAGYAAVVRFRDEARPRPASGSSTPCRFCLPSSGQYQPQSAFTRERLVAPVGPESSGERTPATTPAVPQVVATLFYATSDGLALAPVKREVPLESSPRAQGRQILDAELEAAPDPYLSVIPKG